MSCNMPLRHLVVLVLVIFASLPACQGEIPGDSVGDDTAAVAAAVSAVQCPPGFWPARTVVRESPNLTGGGVHWGKPRNVSDYRGAPAWANDGAKVAMAAELRYCWRFHPNPTEYELFEETNHAFRLFTVVPLKRGWNPLPSQPKTYVTNWIPGNPLEVYYVRSGSYALVRTEGDDFAKRVQGVPMEGYHDFLRVDLVTGNALRVARQALLPNPSQLPYFTHDVIPSPDGSKLADLVCQDWLPAGEEAGSYTIPAEVPCTVHFLDAATLEPLAAPISVALKKQVPERAERAVWTQAGTLIVTDRQAAAWEVKPRRREAPHVARLFGAEHEHEPRFGDTGSHSHLAGHRLRAHPAHRPAARSAIRIRLPVTSLAGCRLRVEEDAGDAVGHGATVAVAEPVDEARRRRQCLGLSRLSRRRPRRSGR